MIDRQESRRPDHYQDRQPVFLTPARQAPIHLAPIQEQLFLKMSSQMGMVWTGPELLRFAWSRAGLSWNHDNEQTQRNNRQHVIGAMHDLRSLLRAHGQYEIDTTYPQQDGQRGWRLREMTNEDRQRLRSKGYFGGSYYEYALAQAAERPALEAGEPEPSRAQSSPERSDEHHLLGGSSASDLPSSSLEVAPPDPEGDALPVLNGNSDRSLVTQVVEPLEGDHRREPLPASGDRDDAVVGQLGQVFPQRLFSDPEVGSHSGLPSPDFHGVPGVAEQDKVGSLRSH